MTETTRIGSAQLLEEAPTVVTVGDSRYILTRDEDDEPILYAAVCPHQGGRVKVADESTLRCPTHRWEFDPATGECTRGGEGELTAYEVRIEDDELYATLD